MNNKNNQIEFKSIYNKNIKMKLKKYNENELNDQHQQIFCDSYTTDEEKKMLQSQDNNNIFQENKEDKNISN